MGQTAQISIKHLALSVLAKGKSVPQSNAPQTQWAGTKLEKDLQQPALLPPCGSKDCAGCYDVGDERKIHPPKCGEQYQKWLERWQPKGKPR